MFFFKKKIKNQTPVVTPPTPQPEKIQVIPPAPVIETKIKTYKITGMSHYLDNILKLSSENMDYDLSKKELIDEGYYNERIYQYNFYPGKVELVPEPDNPYDPNAVKVIVDNELVGYVKSGSCKHILKIIAEDRIEKIDCEIGGGKYKYIGYDEDEEKYYLDKGDLSYFVHLIIKEK